MKTTRSALIKAVTEELGIRREEACEVVETIFSEIVAAVARGERVELRGIGTFRKRMSAVRRGRDFKAGREIDLHPVGRVAFKVSRKLRKAVARNGGRSDAGG